MEIKMVAGQEARADYKADRVIIHLGRQTVVWSDGRWVDDNRGRSYMNWQARDQLKAVFNLK